jgi:ABC-2 type transport system permease protein
MKKLAGTGSLIRFVLRRDRLRIPLWIAGIAALVFSTASSIQGLYKTPEQLANAAAVVEDNPAMLAMNGPANGLETLGGRITWEVGAIGFAVMALMSMFLVGRHTRAEEESGRSELVRAAVVGRYAPTTAALIVVAALNVLIGALVAIGLIALDLPAPGSIALGAGLASVGLVFGAITASVAQLTEHNRATYGITAALVGVAYVVRAAGDAGDGTLSWLSPIGWGQAIRPYADERWFPLLLSIAVTAIFIYLAFALTARRDFGAGMVRPRPGPATASGALTRPLGLAFRLQRGAWIGWTVGLFFMGVAYGSVGKDVEDLVADNEALADILAQAGGSLTDSFFATTTLVLALIGSAFAVQSALRLRSEETAGRAEPVLATAITRPAWAGSHLLIALGGVAVVLAAAGLGTGLSYGVSIDDLGQVPRLMGAALAHVPAAWVLVGVTAALIGVAPRAAMAGWGALGVCVLIGVLGDVLGLPEWVTGLSPFDHIPQAPSVDVSAAPLVILTGVSIALTALGLLAFRRRDLAT